MTATASDSPSGMYYDEFRVGDSWETPARTITEADVVAFAAFSGDYHPLHTDEEYAKTTQFGTRIFHGPGVFAIATGLESRLGFKVGTAIAFLGMTWRLMAPVHMGDTIRVRERVASMRESRKPDRGVVIFDLQVLNQRDEVCHEGEWVLLFKRRVPE